MNFDFGKIGKASFSASKAGAKGTVKKDNSKLNKDYAGQSVVLIPQAATKKGHGTIFILTDEAIKGLNVQEGVQAYVGVASMNGKPYLLNLAGVLDEETLKKDLKFARLTDGGTFSSKYIAEALVKAGYALDKTQYVTATPVKAGNVSGALELGNILKEEVVTEEENVDVEENSTVETGNADQQEVVSEVVEDAVVEATEEASTDEFEW